MALQESSGLHSLAALREHEKRQIQLQNEAARARAEAEQRARHEAERELSRAERERQRIERAASDAAELARREELTRLDVARLAELERAERATRRSEALQLELLSERGARRTAELASSAVLLRQRLYTLGSAALCVATWLGTAAFYFGSLRPEAERARLEGERIVADERRARTDAQASGARLLRRNEELTERVSALEQRLREPVAPAPLAPTHGAPPTKPGLRLPHGVTTSAPPCRDDGDPLNPCLRPH